MTDFDGFWRKNEGWRMAKIRIAQISEWRKKTIWKMRVKIKFSVVKLRKKSAEYGQEW
jgi:hypothetical protein